VNQPYNPKDCPMPLDFYLRRYDISRTTAWRWRKHGLPTLQVGSKVFVRETDFVAFLERMNGKTVSAVSLKNQETI
jgi:hypothetical protein